MPRFVVAVALLSISSSALAAEYYVAKDPTTQACSVTTEKPDGTKLVLVGTSAYATQEEAKAAKKAAKKAGECKKSDNQANEGKDESKE
jgi:hypothetical protein